VIRRKGWSLQSFHPVPGDVFCGVGNTANINLPDLSNQILVYFFLETNFQWLRYPTKTIGDYDPMHVNPIVYGHVSKVMFGPFENGEIGTSGEAWKGWATISNFSNL